MEEWKAFLSWLNECAGLFALLVLVAAIAMPLFIYWLQKRSERKACQEEYDALMNSARLPMTNEQRCFAAKKQLLEKRLKK